MPEFPSVHRFHPAFVLMASIAMLLARPVEAAALTYDADSSAANGITDGTTGAWNTTALDWFDGTNDVAWPNTSADIAIFGGGTSGTAGTVTVGTVTANGIVFNTPSAGTYTLNLGTISLAGTTPTITVNAASVSITSALTSSSLIKNGTGTLTLNNGADSLGAVTANAGQLDIFTKMAMTDFLVNGAANFGTHSGTIWTMNSLTYSSTATSNFTSLGAGSTSTYTISGGFTINSGTIIVAAGTAPSTNATSIVNAQGGLTMAGGTLSMQTATTGSTAQFNLGGDINVTGNSSVTGAGTAVGARIFSLGGAIRTVAVNDSTVTFNLGASVQNGGLTKTGAGILILNGSDANAYTGMTTLNGGSLHLAKTAGVTAIAGDVTVTTGVLDWDAANVLSDTSSIFLNGGSLRFDAFAETFANLTQTAGNSNDGGGGNGGFLTLTGFLKASGGSSINLNSGGQWTVRGLTDFTGFSGAALALNGNGSRLTLYNAFGGLTLSGQKLSLEIGNTAGALGSELALGGDVTASGTNSITYNPANTIGFSRVNLGTGTRTWNITSGTTTVDSSIVSLTAGDGATTPARTAVVGGINKTGTGTLQLNGVNTYTGNTTITAGTFKLGGAGSIDTTPLISVRAGATYDVSAITGYTLKSGQTLEGGGTIKGAVTANSGSIISGGVSGDSGTQTLSFANGLTANSGSIVMLDFSSSGNEKLSITGTFVQGTGAKIVIGPAVYTGALSIGQSFDFVDWTMGFTASTNLGPTVRDGSADGSFDLDLPDISSTGLSWDTSNFASSGVILVVPEPGAALLLPFGFALLGLRRRARKLF